MLLKFQNDNVFDVKWNPKGIFKFFYVTPYSYVFIRHWLPNIHISFKGYIQFKRKKNLDLNFLFRLIGCIEWGKFDPPKRVIQIGGVEIHKNKSSKNFYPEELSRKKNAIQRLSWIIKCYFLQKNSSATYSALLYRWKYYFMKLLYCCINYFIRLHYPLLFLLCTL